MGTHVTAGAATSKAIAARVPRRWCSRRAEEMSPYIIVAQSSGGKYFDLSQVIFRTDGAISNEAIVFSSVDLDEERRERKKKMSSTSPETDYTLKCIALVQDRPQL